jgi:putative MATE family efflux protein
MNATLEFLKYRSAGIFAVMLATVFRSFYVGIARPGIYAVYSFLMAGINILMGYALIFGHLGCDPMGIRGAGLASTLAECSGFVFLLLYTLLRSDIKHYKLFHFDRWQNDLAKNIFNLSAPLVVQNLLSMGAWFLFFVFMEKLGEHDLAISNIVRAAYMISMTPIWGLSISANSMVSNVIGQKKFEEVMPLLIRIIRLSFVVSAFMVLINLLFPDYVLSLFTNKETLIHDARHSLEVVDLSMFFFSFAIVSISALSGTGATRIALLIEIGAILVYMVYNYFVTFALHGPAELLWMSEVIYWSLTGIASYYYIRSMRWKTIHV